MTLATISKPLSAMFASAVLLAATSAQAAPGDHLDYLAVKLQNQSRSLLGEFRLHYAHTNEYRHLVSDAYSMHRLAGHIHALAHTSQSLHHIESDLRQLDRLLHHVHELVDHREIHPHGGHVHGDTGHVHLLLRQMEDTLHHMQSDVRQLTAPNHGFPAHGMPGHGFGGGSGIGGGHGNSSHGQFSGSSNGFTIRSGRFSMRFIR